MAFYNQARFSITRDKCVISTLEELDEGIVSKINEAISELKLIPDVDSWFNQLILLNQYISSSSIKLDQSFDPTDDMASDYSIPVRYLNRLRKQINKAAYEVVLFHRRHCFINLNPEVLELYTRFAKKADEIQTLNFHREFSGFLAELTGIADNARNYPDTWKNSVDLYDAIITLARYHIDDILKGEPAEKYRQYVQVYYELTDHVYKGLKSAMLYQYPQGDAGEYVVSQFIWRLEKRRVDALKEIERTAKLKQITLRSVI